MNSIKKENVRSLVPLRIFQRVRSLFVIPYGTPRCRPRSKTNKATGDKLNLHLKSINKLRLCNILCPGDCYFERCN